MKRDISVGQNPARSKDQQAHPAKAEPCGNSKNRLFPCYGRDYDTEQRADGRVIGCSLQPLFFDDYEIRRIGNDLTNGTMIGRGGLPFL